MQGHDSVDQDALFYDCINDAIGSVVMACGGWKKVAGDMWPHMALNSAYARLKNACRDDKDEKLSQQELCYLIKRGREVGCHALMNYLCDFSSYEQPKAMAPRDEMAELHRQFIAAAKAMKGISERIDRVNLREVG